MSPNEVPAVLDVIARSVLSGPLDRIVAWLDRPWVSPNRITLAGLLLGMASAGAAAMQWWSVALVLWLVSRFADGLDGPLARRRVAMAGKPSPGARGALLDIVADFAVYGATVAGVAWGTHTAFGTSPWPFLLVLLAYYVNGSVFLATSALATPTLRPHDDGRAFGFPVGFAGATETIIVHSLWLAAPAAAGMIALVWAIVVLANASWQLVGSYRRLA